MPVKEIFLYPLIHHLSPYRTDKNLGKAYNEAISLLPEEDWVCLRDWDTMPLLPDTFNRIEKYVELYPDAGLLTCYTNRIHPLSPQLHSYQPSENTNILAHIEIAKGLLRFEFKATEIHSHVSGFLMVLSVKTWKEFPFIENGGCLGVDTDLWRRLKAAGKKMLRMDSIYVFHLYRLGKDIKDTSHL